MHLGLLRGQFGQHAAQAQGFKAEFGAHPVAAAGGGVALVEDQVDHFEHRAQALGQLLALWHLKGHTGVGQRAFGTHDALGNGAFGHQKGARNFVGGQAAKQLERQRHPRVAASTGWQAVKIRRNRSSPMAACARAGPAHR
jgi:hypothetical protein